MVGLPVGRAQRIILVGVAAVGARGKIITCKNGTERVFLVTSASLAVFVVGLLEDEKSYCVNLSKLKICKPQIQDVIFWSMKVNNITLLTVRVFDLCQTYDWFYLISASAL